MTVVPKEGAFVERVNRIIKNKLYRDYINKNREAERDRQFCRHDMGHFLDVARIGMILKEKEGCSVSDELLYAAALLHDIGRWQQYQEGTPHEQASAKLAPPILTECGFGEEEKNEILEAIFSHRDASVKEEQNLKGLLYRADKLSRACFACEAEKDCNWKKDKKNLQLRW